MDDNEFIDEIENTPIYVYINGAKDSLRIAYDLDKINKYEYLYSNHKQIWTKKDIGEIIKAFNISDIELPNKKKLSKNLFIKDVSLPYEENLRTIKTYYFKKLIYLIRKTGAESFLYLLTTRKILILCKPSDNKEINLDYYIDKNITSEFPVIPIFSDSNTLRAYLKNNKDINEEYKPLLMKFTDAMHHANELKTGLCIDPDSYLIKNKNFSLLISPKLRDYIHDEVRNHYKTFIKSYKNQM